MQSVKAVGLTAPMVEGVGDAQELVAYCARVSNPSNQLNGRTAGKLLDYCMRNAHWSVFEMVNVVLEVNTTRDIARQILRHRSFSFQEFCVAEGTQVTMLTAGGKVYKRPVEKLFEYQSDSRMNSIWDRGIRVFDEATSSFVRSTIKEVFKTGVKPCYRVELDDGKVITCTDQHRFFTKGGYSRLADLRVGDFVGVNGQPVYQSADWMKEAKIKALIPGGGVQAIADLAGVSYHTIRKWLKKHGLQFTKQENSLVAGGAWNKGLPAEQQPMYGKLMSAETREKMRGSSRSGQQSNLYKHGNSADVSHRMKVFRWQNKYRNTLIKKFSGICAGCGADGKLEIDHKLPVSLYPELAFEFDNLQLLCPSCHRAKSNSERQVVLQTVRWKAIKSIEFVGDMMTYDLEVDHTSHNYIANGIVTHNSQRYADATQLEWVGREARLQDQKNRQNSVEVDDEELKDEWGWKQAEVMAVARHNYKWALERGIAKEVARAVLPEGLMMSRMYVNGTLRSWIHYCDVRRGNGTQKEHREVAEMAWQELCKVFGFLTRMGR